MSKQYFAKYLPVEGEIRKGMKYILTEGSNLGAYTTGYIGTAAIDFIPEAQEFQGGKILKLFLCSRDIQVGDKVRSFNYPEQEEREVMKLRTSKKLVGAENHSEIYHLADIQYPNEINTAAVSNFFKVIGEILTLGIIENQEFTEKEIKFLTIGENIS